MQISELHSPCAFVVEGEHQMHGGRCVLRVSRALKLGDGLKEMFKVEKMAEFPLGLEIYLRPPFNQSSIGLFLAPIAACS
jgi:hypothetical protein